MDAECTDVRPRLAEVSSVDVQTKMFYWHYPMDVAFHFVMLAFPNSPSHEGSDRTTAYHLLCIGPK